MKKIYLISVLIFLFSFSSCITSNLFTDRKADNNVEALDSIFFPNSNYQYKIQRNDKITISVWEQEDLSIGSSFGIYNSNEVYGKWLMVDYKGNIPAPKIGVIQIEGKTIIELKDSLTNVYKEWVKNPIVDIKILNRQITVLGEVKEPQIINIDKEKNTLINMITTCKGFDAYADLRHIRVFRQVGENVHIATLDLSKSEDYLYKNIDLHSGDVVVVPSKKYKVFDRRISTIIPFTTAITAAAIFIGLFNK